MKNFFYYLGLFTINAFKHNLRPMVIATIIIGSIMSLVFRNAWHFIPCFIGGYVSMIWLEYIEYKKKCNQ